MPIHIFLWCLRLTFVGGPGRQEQGFLFLPFGGLFSDHLAFQNCSLLCKNKLFKHGTLTRSSTISVVKSSQTEFSRPYPPPPPRKKQTYLCTNTFFLFTYSIYIYTHISVYLKPKYQLMEHFHPKPKKQLSMCFLIGEVYSLGLGHFGYGGSQREPWKQRCFNWWRSPRGQEERGGSPGRLCMDSGLLKIKYSSYSSTDLKYV